MKKAFSRFVLTSLMLLFSPIAWADSPQPWQIYCQVPATPTMEQLYDFHTFLLVIEGMIVLLVVALIVFVTIRFRASRNPIPSRVSHNTWLEIIWTLLPVLILIVIAVPSFKLLYVMDVTPKAELTLKATGSQWYWTYDYPDLEIHFDSHIVPEDKLKPGQLRLFEVDHRVVVPTHTTIRLLTTSTDVIHSWAVPAFGVKKDSIPGRLNETWFRIQREGVYYGQCSELCGVNHGFMPIVVEAVSKENFDKWVASQRQKTN